MRTKDENKRQAIYFAAIKVITEQGLEQASNAKIAKEARVSPSTLYVYFDNKQDMLNKLYLMVKQDSADAVFRDFPRHSGIRDRLSAFMRNYFYYLVKYPVKFSFQEQFINSPQISANTQEEAVGYFSLLVDLHKEGLENGILRNESLALLGAYIFDPVFRLAKIHLQGDIPISEQMLENAIEMSWRAITI